MMDWENDDVGSSVEDDEDERMEVDDMDSGSESDDEAELDDDGDMFSATSAGTATKTKKKKRKRKGVELDAKGNPKLSSRQIKELQESEVLGQSNLYRFQIDELLSEVLVKSKVRVKIQEWLIGLRTLLDTSKPSKSYPLNSCKKLLGDIKLPFPSDINPKRADKSTFQWSKPESIQEIGSWCTNTAVGKLSALDIAVEMPSSLFHKTDILNHVYHYKRALYVAYVAKKLRNLGDDVKFSYFNGDPLKPILSVFIKFKKLLFVRIHFILPQSFDKFPVNRLAPTRNNVRADYFLGTTLEGEETGAPTPAYNQSILHDMLFHSSHEILESITKSQSVCDAIKLLKVWLAQRSLSQGFGSFSGFIMTMFVAYLAHNKKIHMNMSSYQIIRIVLVNLSQLDWCNNGLTFDEIEKSTLEEWHAAHEVVFLDPSCQLNYATNMSHFTFNRVRKEAKLAVDHLNSATTLGFQSMFITKVPFFLNFDNILQLKVDEDLLQRIKASEKLNFHYLNFSGFYIPLVSRTVGPLIQRCLGDRAKSIDFQLPEVPVWDITETVQESFVVMFGIIINRDLAFKMVEKCESEDGVACQAFKEFWGEKSLLRRFMDGTLTESVTFEDQDNKDRIPFQMVKYILDKHLGISLQDDTEDYLDGQLDRLLEPELTMIKFSESVHVPQVSKGKKRKKLKYSPRVKREKPEMEKIGIDEVTSLASKSFDSLSKALRQLEGLPLNITSVQGTSPVLRFSNIVPSPPQRFPTSKFLTEAMGTYLKIKDSEEDGEKISKIPKHVEPIGVVVQLESSGKWPDDIQAIERLKCAFLIRIGQLLQEQFSFTVQFFSRHLLVLKDGFIFQIRLTYFRELILLKQLRGDDGILRSRDNPESLVLERESLILPQLSSTLLSLHRQFGAFGRTCRLAKRWIASHLLLANSFDHSASNRHHDHRFTEESIELLVASLFLQPAPFLHPPNEAQLGFLRFLNLLGNTDWKSTSFILNFNSKLNKAEIEKIEIDFVKRRDTLPLLFISTPEDKHGSVWTKHLSQTILLRAGVLAKFASDCLLMELSASSASDQGNLKWRKLFTPSTKVFDVIIWIKKGMIVKKCGSIADAGAGTGLKFAEYKKSEDEVMPVVGFDPVKMYFQELREAFGHLCNFVNDVCGGNFIAFAWKPEALKSRHFEISQVRGKKLGKDRKSLVIDVDGILEEIQVMGEGIVDHIELKASNSVTLK